MSVFLAYTSKLLWSPPTTQFQSHFPMFRICYSHTHPLLGTKICIISIHQRNGTNRIYTCVYVKYICVNIITHIYMYTCIHRESGRERARETYCRKLAPVIREAEKTQQRLWFRGKSEGRGDSTAGQARQSAWRAVPSDVLLMPTVNG